MVGLNEGQRYFLYREPTDMRKSFNGLSGIVTNEMDKNPLSGDVFVFINKRRNQMKVLFWETGGFWVYHKRLERGAFELPKADYADISWQELVCIIRGITLGSIRQRKRFSLPKVG